MRHTVGGHKSSHARSGNRLEQPLRVEAWLIWDEDCRLGVPGCKKAAPRMFCPTGRGNVAVYVAWLEPDPIHRREMPDWIRDL